MHKTKFGLFFLILHSSLFQLDESTKRQNDIGVPPDGLDKYKDIPTKQVDFHFE